MANAPTNTKKPAPAKPATKVIPNQPGTSKTVAKKPVAVAKLATPAKAVTTPVVKSVAKPAVKPVIKSAAAPKAVAKAKVAPAKKDHKKEDKKAKPEKVKMERDSFTMPKDEYAAIGLLKNRLNTLGHPVKKSELLRAGIKLLAAMSDNTLKLTMEKIPVIKTGRPKK
ncbi:MAG: hypothetical protein B7X95_05815 [Methylophilaceae bacterium 17-44-8]|nr:MAG: hypothetical protein B7X95_05815 [Methylophilaceae bacterium 17-44-8]